MNIRLWNFRCDACGHVYEGEPITAKRVPKTIKCRQEGCAGRASWHRGKVNGIHETKSTLYGRFDPQFGCVVESYSHKQQLLKEKGLIEVGGPEKKDDILGTEETVAPGDRSMVEKSEAESDEDVMKELTERLYADPRVDRKHTGTPRGFLEGIEW